MIYLVYKFNKEGMEYVDAIFREKPDAEAYIEKIEHADPPLDPPTSFTPQYRIDERHLQ